MNGEKFDKIVEDLKDAGYPFVFAVSGKNENLYQCYVPPDGDEEYSDCYELQRTLKICNGSLRDHMEKLARQHHKGSQDGSV